MPKIKDIIEFRSDLFFDGAVQIGWFESDPARSRQAAANFVFHGPDYHGVSDKDTASEQYALIDTAGFTHEIIKAIDRKGANKSPFALSIAGWGAGKSHLGLTLANLLSKREEDVVDSVLANMASAAPAIAEAVGNKVSQWKHPVLVITINGMNDFDLAAELNRQVMIQLRALNIDTSPIEDLTPRFKIAETFAERNIDLRYHEFIEKFGDNVSVETILAKLRDHDGESYQLVNEIFENANGHSIRASGQESPQQLIQAVCDHYCGDNGPFQSVLILFDEFGRYLEFAAERPHIAGDAALQQLFEGVQNNSENCFLLCFIQYELKAYISRVSQEKRDTVKRYIGRYDSAPKFYLSINLETLFAHLIQKRDQKFINQYLLADSTQWKTLHESIQRWFPKEASQNVWRDSDLFHKVIVEGCWPLHPLAVWFLCRLSSTGKELQQRSAISFIEEVLSQEIETELNDKKGAWCIPATRLCTASLFEELRSSEEYGLRGASAHAFLAAEQRYQNDLNNTEREILLAVLIAAKTKLKADRNEFNYALSAFSGISLHLIEMTVDNLMTEYGILEWNDRFQRYEIIGDAVPRTEFTTFLKNKSAMLSTERIEDLFAANIKKWAELQELTPSFASENEILSNEWRFQIECTNTRRLDVSIKNAVQDWKNAVQVDTARGQLIYCYVPPDTDSEHKRINIKKTLNRILKTENCEKGIPILIVMLHDEEGKLKQILAEYQIICHDLTEDEKQRYTNFVRDYKTQLADELKLTHEEMVQKRNYIYSKKLKIDNTRLIKMTSAIFKSLYPDIMPFPFDGFSTARGNAAKDCREISIELFKGLLNDDWISARNPQTQNRAIGVLRRSWGALGDDGEIGRRPAHTKVREVISLLDQKLKSEKSLNMDDLTEMLILPPFGCNIASASLILGVFISPRKDNIAFLFKGREIQISAWLNEVLIGNFIDRKKLKESEIRYVTKSETDEWQELLYIWDTEPTHFGRFNFFQQAETLNQRIKIPAGYLYEKYKRLQTQAKESFRALAEFREFLDKEEKYYEWAYEKQNVANLSRIGKELTDFEVKMNKEEDAWTSDQVQMITPLIEQTKQAVIQFFDPWLQEQSILKPQQIGDFKHRMLDQVGSNLKKLELPDLYKQVDKYVKNIILNIEERQRAAYITDEVAAFVDSHRISANTKVAELKSWVKNSDELLKSLRKTKRRIDVPDIERLISKIMAFKKSCKNQVNAHRKKAGKLLNRKFSDFEDIRSSRSEVKELLTLFSGQELDMEDIQTMDRQLGQFERDIALWNDYNIPTDELKETAARRIQELLALQSEDEPPPWDVGQVYPDLLNTILKDRLRLAGNWIEAVLTDASVIETMTPEECHKLLKRLNPPPAYLEPGHIKQLDEMKIYLEKRLDDSKVEGLLVRFRELSPVLQKQFLDIAQKFIDQ